MTHAKPHSCPAAPADQSFSDASYLLEVIGHLTRVRMHLDMNIGEVARRAGVSPTTIDRAENDCVIPGCHEFKAWSSALGLSWEKVWSDCLR